MDTSKLSLPIQRTLDFAIDEAFNQGFDFVGTEHLLLALFGRTFDEGAGHVLRACAQVNYRSTYRSLKLLLASEYEIAEKKIEYLENGDFRLKDTHPNRENITFTPLLKNIFEDAISMANKDNVPLSSIYLLNSILYHKDTMAYRLLKKSEFDIMDLIDVINGEIKKLK